MFKYMCMFIDDFIYVMRRVPEALYGISRLRVEFWLEDLRDEIKNISDDDLARWFEKGVLLPLSFIQLFVALMFLFGIVLLVGPFIFLGFVLEKSGLIKEEGKS